MDQSGVPQSDGIAVTSKRRRSQTSRRPKPELQSLPDHSPKSSTHVSDGDNNVASGNSGLKMFNLNQCVSRSLRARGSDSRSNTIRSNDKSEEAGTEDILKKVELKVGGATRPIQTKSGSAGLSGSSSMESSDEYHSPRPDEKNGGFHIVRTSKTNAIDSVRKSKKRMPKKQVSDWEFDEDDEIRYLEKQPTGKQKGFKYENMEHVGKHWRDAQKSRSGDTDYKEEEESLSDDEPKGKKSRKTNKDLSELPTENKRETTLTTRQRALLNAPSASSVRPIEFPNGLPPAPPRKQKEKLSEVEQQLKKTEVAQRRKMQNEKAARESEAEAIRKILGQDSSRKKREEKMKKRREELSKAVNAQMNASNTIRTVIGPTGTTVTFPQEIGFPKIFDSKPYSYPPPREKCAGPFCGNDYKYRDSKSKLPLCSLQCYKAIQTEKVC